MQVRSVDLSISIMYLLYPRIRSITTSTPPHSPSFRAQGQLHLCLINVVVKILNVIHPLNFWDSITRALILQSVTIFH